MSGAFRIQAVIGNALSIKASQHIVVVVAFVSILLARNSFEVEVKIGLYMSVVRLLSLPALVAERDGSLICEYIFLALGTRYCNIDVIPLLDMFHGNCTVLEKDVLDAEEVADLLFIESGEGQFRIECPVCASFVGVICAFRDNRVGMVLRDGAPKVTIQDVVSRIHRREVHLRTLSDFAG